MTTTPNSPPAAGLQIAVVPDSFKGSARASEVAEAISAGFLAGAASMDREISVTAVPFADGGEGTLEALIDAWGTDAMPVQTTDALGRPVQSRLGLSADGKVAVVEAAEAAGLPQVADVPRQPLTATTYGLGALVSKALDLGAEQIILCLGGSATTDGGTGLLSALGAKFLDAGGNQLQPGGGPLNDLHSIDASGLDPRAAGVVWQIACDVTNPLLGENGAAEIFGPQKGASLKDIATLDAGLGRLADVLEAATGRVLREQEGMGAAGGLAFSLGSYFQVDLVPGWELVARVLDAHRIMGGADLVITGEGRLDFQSLQGKVVSGVLQAAGGDVIVIAGSVSLEDQILAEAGILAAYSIAPGPASLAELSADTLALLERTAFSVARTYLHGQTAE
ncbi:glycerate kinase [Glutamicibacter protophormiae]|uniref:glycerate kinase n=1 Tax=Glutamicibacter protophormiae TaxID=37930 RepID=UPI001957D676|nr:glycerate kinase [Glutamicibacter protophormiae]QRQ78460.1 glycerate kinase [Glutamicibacter protophormiae]